MAAFNPVKVTKSVGDKNITVGFTSFGNKHLYSDTFRRSKTFQKGDLLHLPELLEKSIYVSSDGLSKPRKDRITGFYYFKVELHGSSVYLNVAEESVKGKVKRRYLYSVTDRIKEKLPDQPL